MVDCNISFTRTHTQTATHKARGSNISLGEFKCTTTNICISVDRVHLIYRSRGLKHLGKWGEWMETTFPRGGMFWPCQQQAFQRCCFAVLVNFQNKRKRERGKEERKIHEYAENNFLCEHEFFQEENFFVKAKLEWRAWSWARLPQAEWAVLWSIKACLAMNKLSCFVKNI